MNIIGLATANGQTELFKESHKASIHRSKCRPFGLSLQFSTARLDNTRDAFDEIG